VEGTDVQLKRADKVYLSGSSIVKAVPLPNMLETVIVPLSFFNDFSADSKTQPCAFSFRFTCVKDIKYFIYLIFWYSCACIFKVDDDVIIFYFCCDSDKTTKSILSHN